MHRPPMTRSAVAGNAGRLARHFDGGSDLLPLWIAEPYLPLAPEVSAAIERRAAVGWYGYESRPSEVIGAFWGWMKRQHRWDGSALSTLVSPSVGTSIGVLMEQLTEPGDGVILQPPVFTDFKPLVNRAERMVVRNSLALTGDGYRMDLDALEDLAAAPTTRMMILCNPHNPVGRVWTADELTAAAEICARHDVVIIADEIHADLARPGVRFTPFASVAPESGVRWAATHGPIKTFGLAGVCDTLLITDDTELAELFRRRSSQLHLTRNNVFAVAAFTAAYESDGTWLDGLMAQVERNLAALRDGLPEGITLVEPEGTFLAWLDFRALGLDVPKLASWLAGRAELALSPGHWFGREGAGFGRLTVAAPSEWIEEALTRLAGAVERP